MPSQPSSETTAHLELLALERMITVLCKHTEQLSRSVRECRERESREIDLQLQAFDERRTQAMEVINVDTGEPYETRISRLEKLVEALDCSRSYFRSDKTSAETSEWAIRVR